MQQKIDTNKSNIYENIFLCGIIPVIKLDDAADSVPLCSALLDGGINVAEITFRTEAAAQSIKLISEQLPNVLVGAGTVLTIENCKKAIESGAKFIVTPGFNPKIVEYCIEQDILIIPGISNPTDIEMALGYGIETVKFFPAEIFGGVKALKAMAAPYTNIKFMATGGIDLSNLTEYMKYDRISAIGGSFMIKEQLIAVKNFAEITKLTKEAVTKMHGFEFGHVAIFPTETESAEVIAGGFSKAFDFIKEEKPNSIYASKSIEVLKKAGLSKCGHIGIKTNNVKRAMAYMKQNGIEFDMSTLRGTDEKPTFVYLKDSIGGFGVHLVQE